MASLYGGRGLPSQVAARSLTYLRRSAVVHMFLVNGVILALGLAAGIPLARWLGPAGRGEVAAAMLWPVLLTAIASIGLMPSILYHAALPDADLRIIAGNAICLAVAQSLLAVPVGYVLLPLLLNHYQPRVVAVSRLYLLVIPVALTTQYTLSLLQARLRFTLYNILRLVIPSGSVIGIVVLEWIGLLSPTRVVVLYLLLNALVLPAAMMVAVRAGVVRGLAVDLPLAKRMLKYGAQAHIGGLSQLANLRLDQMFIAAWYPPAQLGLYIAAVNSSSLTTVLAHAVRSVVTPRITSAAPEARYGILRRATRKYWMWGLPLTAGMMLVMPIAIRLVFGSEYGAAVKPAIVLVAAALVLGAKEVVAGGVQGLGIPWIASRAEIAGGVTTAIALLALLPTLGIFGAAIASLLAYGTQLLVVLSGSSRAEASFSRSANQPTTAGAYGSTVP